jgi:hypothetical protein
VRLDRLTRRVIERAGLTVERARYSNGHLMLYVRTQAGIRATLLRSLTEWSIRHFASDVRRLAARRPGLQSRRTC